MQTVIRRLRERRVFRGAGYYIVGAWAVLQVGDVIVEPAGLPPWSMTVLLYLLLLGFPLALFLSWRYDITDRGIVRTQGRADGDFDEEALRLRAMDYLVIASLLGIIGVVIWGTLPIAQQAGQTAEDADAAVAAPIDPGTIAVLPFANLGRGEDAGFLGDGISDTVTHVLSQVDGIQVIARTSSFAFRDRNLRVQDIAAALAVAHILEGSVQQVGDQVRIIARLINANSGVEVWSGYYDRGMTAVFDIQDEIAQEVATALRVTVLGGQDVQIANTYQPDMRAFEAFILGREALEKGDSAGLDEAYALFEEAIEIDPEYALAHVMLGRATVMVAMTSRRIPLPVAMQRAGELARKALDLDPLLPEAHVAMAQQLQAMKKFEEASLSAQRALELSPSHAAAYDVLYVINFALGRYDEALAAARRAVELDPEDNDYQMTLAQALWNVGRSENAIATIKKVIRRETDRPRYYAMLSRYLSQVGRSGEAQYWTVRAAALDPGDANLQLNVCLGQLQLWDEASARRCIDAFLEKYPGHPEATQYLASINQDAELGLANARAMVEANPDMWYRKMQLVGWLTSTGGDEEAIGIIRETFPELLADPPQVRDMTIWLAQSLVRAHINLGDRERAHALIDAAVEHLDAQRKLQGSGLATGTDDVMLLGWRGEISEAVDRLEEAIDRDWQFYSFGLMYPEGWPPELYEDPRFQAQVERLRRTMAEERAWFEANRDRDLLASG